MRRFIITIGLSALMGMLLSQGVHAAVGSAQRIESMDQKLFNRLLEQQEVTRAQLKPNKLWKEKEGMHLYLMVLNEVEDKPVHDAVRDLSREVSFAHYTKNEEVFFDEDVWRTVLVEGGAIPAIQKELEIDTVQQAQSVNTLMRQYLEEEIADKTFDARLDQELSKELFSNGNLDDSPYDLLKDVELIESALFASVQDSALDSARADVGAPPIAALPRNVESDATVDSTGGTSTGSESSTGYRPSASRTFAARDREAEPVTDVSALIYNPTGLHPLECNEETNLDDALDDYLNGLPDDIVRPDFDGTRPEGGSDDPGADDAGGDDDDDGSGDVGDDDTGLPDSLGALDTATPHDWQIQDFCNDIFCIEIEFVNDGAGPFGISFGGSQGGILGGNSNDGGSNQCTACYTKSVLGDLNLVLSKTLTPSKTPGNLLESGKCKKGFGGIKPSINIYAVAKPVPVKENPNPLFMSANPLEDYLREVTQGYSTAEGDSRFDRHARHITQYSSGQTTEAIFAELSQANQAMGNEEALNREMTELRNEINSSVQGYQLIAPQLETFQSYFASVDTIMADINANACEKLRSKKSCE